MTLWDTPEPRGDKPHRESQTPSPTQWRAILQARRAAVAVVQKGLHCPSCLPVMLDGCASHGLDCPNMGASWVTTGGAGQRYSGPGGVATGLDGHGRVEALKPTANDAQRDEHGIILGAQNPGIAQALKALVPPPPRLPKAASER